MIKVNPTARRKARRLALQAIYQWQLVKTPPSEIEEQFLQSQPLEKVDVPYFLELLRGVAKHTPIIDEHINPALDRPIKNINPIELAILRIATYEFIHNIEVPYRVIIDEALRLEKTFGALEGYKYANAILDQVARKIRATEVQKSKLRSS